MRYFKRGAKVLVQPGFRQGAQLPAQVVLDSGAPTIVVNATEDPAKMQRVPRTRVQPERAVPQGPQKFYCEESPHGLCVMQRQASPPTTSEMAEGQWTLCSTWVTSRSRPKKSVPTCNRCRHRLGLADA